jgi:hypothetical protein
LAKSYAELKSQVHQIQDEFENGILGTLSKLKSVDPANAATEFRTFQFISLKSTANTTETSNSASRFFAIDQSWVL